MSFYCDDNICFVLAKIQIYMHLLQKIVNSFLGWGGQLVLLVISVEKTSCFFDDRRLRFVGHFRVYGDGKDFAA